MPWAIYADELDVLARQLKRLRFAPVDEAHETRSELVHQMMKLAGRIRESSKGESKIIRGLKQAKDHAIANGPTRKIEAGRRTVDGRVITVDFRGPRRPR